MYVLEEYLSMPDMVIDENAKPLIQDVLDAEEGMDKAEKMLYFINMCCYCSFVSDWSVHVFDLMLCKYCEEHDIDKNEIKVKPCDQN